MTFRRKLAPSWHQEVPGSRWFNADLHVHTIDDHPGGRVKMPPGVVGDPSDPKVLQRYARAFLQGAVRAGVQVLGLTPHATRAGQGPETSAIWQIVDMWNDGEDEDGRPFREKVYAVFPGFEPNVNDGGTGVHLLFLFDPEIGRDRFLSLFEAVMNGRAAWVDGDLRLTDRSATDLLDTIDSRRREGVKGAPSWEYLVLAPHFQNHHGLLKEVRKQVLETFPCDRLAGYELGDEKLPEDFDETSKPGSFLLPFMRTHRQAFFHGSDAYAVPSTGEPTDHELGHRTTWVKMATPRIGALRQTFIARESRLRIAFERGEGGAMKPLREPPDPLAGKRPWLRRVTIAGDAAFFGGPGDKTGSAESIVDLSPDLTCLIGGSMTGKSTLLDGLRVHTGSEMPSPQRLREDVEARGRDRFLAGRPEVDLDTPGRPAGGLRDRWPAVFYTQNELQHLARDAGAVEDILARFAPDQRTSILERNSELEGLDRTLAELAEEIGDMLDERAEAEQKLIEAQKANEALNAFEEAGLATMQTSEKLHETIRRAAEQAEQAQQTLASAQNMLKETAVQSKEAADVDTCIQRLDSGEVTVDLKTPYDAALDAVRGAVKGVSRWMDELTEAREAMWRAVASDRDAVEKRLAEKGFGAEQLAEFQALSSRAGGLSVLEEAHKGVQARLDAADATFEKNRKKRAQLTDAQRAAMDGVSASVNEEFNGRIRVRRVKNGRVEDLESFLLDFRQKGITQWWRSQDPEAPPEPETIFRKLETSSLEELGVSSTVATRFEEVLTKGKQYALRAIRSPDRYVLELEVGDGQYRAASQLSGGKRVSLLLSLLLRAHDERPLVIDQPEDELDNRFLWKTVLPALRRLKGRRQVIVATHDANIVVNGDADLVVQLDADATHGSVASAGAIEEPAVRTAVIETVDGGELAFELRKAKYGF